MFFVRFFWRFVELEELTTIYHTIENQDLVAHIDRVGKQFLAD